MLVEPVIIAGDGTGADIGARADTGVADVGEVVDLGPRLHARLLDLDEIADMDLRPDIGPGPEPREGPDNGIGADRRALDMAIGPDFHAVADADPGPEPDMWADHHVAAEPRVKTEINRGRVHQGRAGGQGGAAQAGLHGRLGRRQVGPGIHADQALGFGFGRPARDAVGPREPDHVGQIQLSLGVVGGEPTDQPAQKIAAGRRHQAGIAKRYGLFRWPRVGRLDDAEKGAVFVQHQAPVPVIAFTMETEDGNAVAVVGQGIDDPGQRLGGDQGHVAIGDDDGALACPERSQGDAHRVTGAERFLLDTGLGGRDGGPDRVLAGRGHHNHML